MEGDSVRKPQIGMAWGVQYRLSVGAWPLKRATAEEPEYLTLDGGPFWGAGTDGGRFLGAGTRIGRRKTQALRSWPGGRAPCSGPGGWTKPAFVPTPRKRFPPPQPLGTVLCTSRNHLASSSLSSSPSSFLFLPVPYSPSPPYSSSLSSSLFLFLLILLFLLQAGRIL